MEAIDPACIWNGQAQEIAFGNETFDCSHVLADIACQVFRFAVLSADAVEHLLNGLASSIGIVCRKHLPRIKAAPELACDDIHVPLNPLEFGVRIRQHLVGGEAGVEFQFELPIKLLASQPPFARGAREQIKTASL